MGLAGTAQSAAIAVSHTERTVRLLGDNRGGRGQVSETEAGTPEKSTLCNDCVRSLRGFSCAYEPTAMALGDVTW